MSDHLSLLKARFCRAVLVTAERSSLVEARRLIEALSSEPLTSGTTRVVATAERDALAAILLLSERFNDRTAAIVQREWQVATIAVLRWIQSAS